MTWKLWRALRRMHHSHPLYHRTIEGFTETGYRHSTAWVAVGGIIALYVCAIMWPALMSTPLLLGLILLSGSVLGAVWGQEVSATIAAAHEFGTYDLLCLSPSGPLGANWAISMGVIHRSRAFERLNEQHIWAMRAFLMIPMMIWFGLQLPQPYVREASFMPVGLAAVLIAGFCLDHIQATILGVLVGVYVPTRAHRRFEAQLFAVTTLLITQLTAYLLALGGGVAALELLREDIAVINPTADFVAALIALGIIYVVREIAITILWRRMCERLNATPAERERVLRVAL